MCVRVRARSEKYAGGADRCVKSGTIFKIFTRKLVASLANPNNPAHISPSDESSAMGKRKAMKTAADGILAKVKRRTRQPEQERREEGDEVPQPETGAFNPHELTIRKYDDAAQVSHLGRGSMCKNPVSCLGKAISAVPREDPYTPRHLRRPSPRRIHYAREGVARKQEG